MTLVTNIQQEDFFARHFHFNIHFHKRSKKILTNIHFCATMWSISVLRQILGKLILEKVYFLFSTCRIVYHFKTGTLQTGVEALAVMIINIYEYIWIYVYIIYYFQYIQSFQNGHFADGCGGPSGDRGGSQEAAWSPDSEEAQEQGKRNYALRESESDLDKEHGLRETLTLTFTHTFSR